MIRAILLILLLLNLSVNHDAPENIIQKNNIKMYGNSFTVETDFELRYATFQDTNSMVPTLDYGHHAVEMVCPCKLKHGDLISYKRGEQTILHRVTDIEGEFVYAKGDNTKEGEWVNSSEVIGKVVALIY